MRKKRKGLGGLSSEKRKLLKVLIYNRRLSLIAKMFSKTRLSVLSRTVSYLNGLLYTMLFVLVNFYRLVYVMMT